jgi:hypothetical protein
LLEVHGWPGNAPLDCIESRLGAVRQVELAQDIAHMLAHRALADDQLVGNLLVRPALGDEAEHLDLSVREFFADRRWAGRPVQLADQRSLGFFPALAILGVLKYNRLTRRKDRNSTGLLPPADWALANLSGDTQNSKTRAIL